MPARTPVAGPCPPRLIGSREPVEQRRHRDEADPVHHLDPESDPGHGGAAKPRRDGLHGGGGGPVHRRLAPPFWRREHPHRVMPPEQLLRGHHPRIVTEDDDPPVLHVVLHIHRARRRDEDEDERDRRARGQEQARMRAPAAPHRRQAGHHPGATASGGKPAGGLHQRRSHLVVQVRERSRRANRREDGRVPRRAQCREHRDAEAGHDRSRHGEGTPRSRPGGRAIPRLSQDGERHLPIID